MYLCVLREALKEFSYPNIRSPVGARKSHTGSAACSSLNSQKWNRWRRMKRIGPLSSILFHGRSRSHRMQIMTKGCKEDKVEKIVFSEKDSETVYSEHVDERSLGMDVTTFMLTESLKDGDYGLKLCTSDAPEDLAINVCAGLPFLVSSNGCNIGECDEEAGTCGQSLKKKPKLSETDLGKREIKQTFIMSKRKRRCIKSERKQRVPIEDSTPILKGRPLQLGLENIGEEAEEEEDPRTRHLKGANELEPTEAFNIKVAIDPANGAEVISRFNECLSPEFTTARVFHRETSRTRGRYLKLEWVPAGEGEEEGHWKLFYEDELCD